MLLRELVLSGPSSIYELRGRLVCSSAQRARDSLLKLGCVEILRTAHAARGGKEKIILGATRLGVWVFLCTLLETPEEAARVALRHASTFPLILGKWDHFVKAGVSELVLKILAEIPPWIGGQTIRLGEKLYVKIGSSKQYDDLTWAFYLEAEHTLPIQEKERWKRALITDKELTELNSQLLHETYKPILDTLRAKPPT